MHELSIAVEIVRQAVEAVGEHHATRIDSVDVEVGVMRRVVPDALQLAFHAAAEGTIAAEATLNIAEERVVAVCNECECLFLPEIDNFVCPQCSAADAKIVSGNEIILRSVVCEAPEGAAVP